MRKDALTAAQLARIRKDLFVTPYNPVKQEMLRQQQRRARSGGQPAPTPEAADPDSFNFSGGWPLVALVDFRGA